MLQLFFPPPFISWIHVWELADVFLLDKSYLSLGRCGPTLTRHVLLINVQTGLREIVCRLPDHETKLVTLARQLLHSVGDSRWVIVVHKDLMRSMRVCSRCYHIFSDPFARLSLFLRSCSARNKRLICAVRVPDVLRRARASAQDSLWLALRQGIEHRTGSSLQQLRSLLELPPHIWIHLVSDRWQPYRSGFPISATLVSK